MFIYNAGNPIIILPFRDGFYHPLMVEFSMAVAESQDTSSTAL
jgi:hypothetical protein